MAWESAHPSAGFVTGKVAKCPVVSTHRDSPQGALGRGAGTGPPGPGPGLSTAAELCPQTPREAQWRSHGPAGGQTACLHPTSHLLAHSPAQHGTWERPRAAGTRGTPSGGLGTEAAGGGAAQGPVGYGTGEGAADLEGSQDPQAPGTLPWRPHSGSASSLLPHLPRGFAQARGARKRTPPPQPVPRPSPRHPPFPGPPSALRHLPQSASSSRRPAQTPLHQESLHP